MPANKRLGTDETSMKTGFELQRFSRNAYFYGKLMTVRDFQLEQEYLNEKRFLGNRLIHGRGIVCGLKVEKVGFGTGSSANKVIVTVSAGVALDGCGREIIADRTLTDVELEVPGITGLSGTKKYYLVLKYNEVFGEPVPSLADASGCEETCCHSRIVEGLKLALAEEWPACGEAVDTGTPPQCATGEDQGVLLVVLDISKTGEVRQAAVNVSETKKCHRVVYNNPLLYQLYSDQEALLNKHLGDLNNPHQVKHPQTGPVGWESPGGPSERAKHVSTNDATNWNNAAQNIGNHLSDTNNPHKVQHDQTGPLGWDQAAEKNIDEKKKRNKHVSSEDVEKWNQPAPHAAQHIKVEIASVAQGERKELNLKLKLDFNESVVLGVEVQLSKDTVNAWLASISENTGRFGTVINKDSFNKWYEKVINEMSENKIEAINEYYTGDLALFDSMWALVLVYPPRLLTADLITITPQLKQVPVPALAARVDRRGKKMTVILQDRREKDTKSKELVNYTVVVWVSPANSK